MCRRRATPALPPSSALNIPSKRLCSPNAHIWQDLRSDFADDDLGEGVNRVISRIDSLFTSSPTVIFRRQRLPEVLDLM